MGIPENELFPKRALTGVQEMPRASKNRYSWHWSHQISLIESRKYKRICFRTMSAAKLHSLAGAFHPWVHCVAEASVWIREFIRRKCNRRWGLEYHRLSRHAV